MKTQESFRRFIIAIIVSALLATTVAFSIYFIDRTTDVIRLILIGTGSGVFFSYLLVLIGGRR